MITTLKESENTAQLLFGQAFEGRTKEQGCERLEYHAAQMIEDLANKTEALEKVLLEIVLMWNATGIAFIDGKTYIEYPNNELDKAYKLLATARTTHPTGETE